MNFDSVSKTELLLKFQPESDVQKYLSTIMMNKVSIFHDYKIFGDMVSIKNYCEYELINQTENIFFGLRPERISDNNYFYSNLAHYFFEIIYIFHEDIEDGSPIYTKHNKEFTQLNKSSDVYKKLMHGLVNAGDLEIDYCQKSLSNKYKYLTTNEYSSTYISLSQHVARNLFFGEYQGGDIEREIRQSAYKFYIEGRFDFDQNIQKSKIETELKPLKEIKYLNIIAAMQNLLKGGGQYDLPFTSDEHIKDALEDLNKDTKKGFSKRALDDVFRDANKVFKNQ